MTFPVAFVLHFTTPLQLLAVKVELSPTQRLVLLANTLGTVGLSPVLMINPLEALLLPHTFVHVAV